MRSLKSLAVAVALLAASLPMLGAAPNLTPQQTEAIKKIHPSLLEPGQHASVVVRLSAPPLLETLGKNAKSQGIKLSQAEQAAYIKRLRTSHADVIKLVASNGGSIAGEMTKSLNAVLVSVDTDVLPQIAALASVATIKPVAHFALDLSETVPYIGAASAQASGYTGEGLRIAILDTGIDYTHRNLGGPGTVSSYKAAYGAGPEDPKNTTRDGLFPTAKVIGGWDFLGEEWPEGPDGFDGDIAPDEDPIDFDGHGTHVADIAAGESTDGKHKGVAPGASLYAFKICSASAVACNGFSTLLALEACLSPDHPVDFESIENPVDVINMSLGSLYGQMQDDSAYVVELLTFFGITIVAAAGNDGDRPYVVSSASIAPGAISVAETQVPSAKAFSIRIFKNGNRVTSTIINTSANPWAPVKKTVTGPLVYVGRGCEDDAYLVPEASVKGAIAIIDRGSCNVSLKVDRAARLGAKGVIIVNNRPGDPPPFSQGGGSLFVPTLVVSQAEGNALKESLNGNNVKATFGPKLTTKLGGSMVSASSRGPSYSFQAIKPEIGAPGASVSAVVGTGKGEAAFGGTSGATPMVTGAAALVQSRFVEDFGFLAPPFFIKALLMNNAEPEIYSNPLSSPGVLAPITRIGAGEVRVDRAISAEAMAFCVDEFDLNPTLSFGYEAILNPGPITLTRTLVVLDLSDTDRTFDLSNKFRYADDEATGAVKITFDPPVLDVPAFDAGEVQVTMTIDPSKLPEWALNGGTLGADGNAFRLQEFDGYVQIKGGGDCLNIPWHILPRKAADMRIAAGVIDPGDTLIATSGVKASAALNGSVLGGPVFGAPELASNLTGATTGKSEIFMLGGTSPLDYPKPDDYGANIALPDLKAAGIRVKGDALEVGIATFEERSHPSYPAEFDVYLDTDNDGTEDFVLYNVEATGNMHVRVVNLASGDVVGEYPADVDFNSAMVIYNVPLAQLGLTASSKVGWYVLSFDNYFTGVLTDYIADEDNTFLIHTLDRPVFSTPLAPTLTLAPGTSTPVFLLSAPVNQLVTPSQHGLLFLHRNAAPGRWSDVIELPIILDPD